VFVILFINAVVKAVVADVNYGGDSALPESMGYVRKSVGASGLTRKSKAAKTDAVKKWSGGGRN